MDAKLNRGQLRKAEDWIWKRTLKGLRSSRRWQNAIKVVLILCGALIGAVGGGMEGPLRPTGNGILTLKGLMVIGGGFMAFLGGFLLLFIDENLPELLSGARNLAASARGYLDERDAKDRQLADFEALDRRRRALSTAASLMVEALEQSLTRAGVTVETAIKFMLRMAISNIDAAIGFDAGELWSVSIFRVEGDGADQHLNRIAVLRNDRSTEDEEGRKWCRMEGFVGAAWHSEKEVVIGDSRDPLVVQDYPVPAEKRKDDDAAKYRAMAAIPIRVGPKGQIWGVVAASSNVQDRFRRDPANHRAQNVDTVRMIAKMIALAAAAFRKA
jgi:hypothetical protein